VVQECQGSKCALNSNLLSVMVDDNQIQWLTVIVGFTGVIIGSLITGAFTFLSSHISYLNRLKNEQKTIAKAIDIDLKTISESFYFKEAYEFHRNNYVFIKEENDFDDIISSFGNMFNTRLYDDDKDLLYFVFIHDIAKLDYNLSSEIYEFYNVFFKANKYSMYIYRDAFESDLLFEENKHTRNASFSTYLDMSESILKCGDNIPKLREKLKEVYELKD